MESVYTRKIQKLKRRRRHHKIRMYNVIFLDVDGVLAPFRMNGFSKTSIEYLNRLIDNEALNIRIVFVTGRRMSGVWYANTINDLKKAGLNIGDNNMLDLFDGKDEPDVFSHNYDAERSDDVFAFLSRHPVERFIIVDDYPINYRNSWGLDVFLVSPDPERGFNKEDYNTALGLLSSDKTFHDRYDIWGKND